MAVKTITVRLPETTYQRLCQFAESSEELPSETARNILRGALAILSETADSETSSVLKEFAARAEAETNPVLKRLLNGAKLETKDLSELEVRLEISGFKNLSQEAQNRLRKKYGLPQVVKGVVREDTGSSRFRKRIAEARGEK